MANQETFSSVISLLLQKKREMKKQDKIIRKTGSILCNKIYRMVIKLLHLALLLWAGHLSTGTDLADCPRDWFGDTCMYMCHCNTTQCDKAGECKAKRCSSPFFGPSCQYTDLALMNETTAMPPELTNHNAPCKPDMSRTAVSLTLKIPESFLWFRIRTSETEFLLNFTLKINDAEICENERRFNLSSTEVDVTCDTSILLSKVELQGLTAPYVCTIRICGGRNVALKQETMQSSNLMPDYMEEGESLRAVDGNTNPALTDNTCALTSNEPSGPSWYLVFNRPQILYRVYIVGRTGAQGSLLHGFILETYDERKNITERYVDPNTFSAVYNVSLRARELMTSLKIFRPPLYGMTEVTLTLCEVLTYGETICPDGNYGIECKGICKCQEGEICNLVTGLCAPGCGAGRFGFNCSSNCSQLCHEGKCQHRFGGCYHCIPGREGEDCSSECQPGNYGLDCKEVCSPYCLELCNVESGACSCSEHFLEPLCKDCRPGFYGDNCTEDCPDNCDKHICNKATGDCTSCLGGRVGHHCEDCPDSYYGSLCYTKCSAFCYNGTCDRLNGSCPVCTEGYSGPQCVVAPKQGFSWNMLLILPIISLLVGLCTIFLLRRKTEAVKNRHNQEITGGQTGGGESSAMSMDSVTLNKND